MFAGDLALVGGHFPFARCGTRDSGHSCVAIDFRAAVTRAAGHRLRQICWLDIAVIRVLDRPDKAVRIAERPDLLHLLRGEKIDLYPDGAGDTGILPIFVHPLLRLCQPDIRHIAETDIHAGFFLQFLVELHRIFVNLPDRIGHVEQRQKARRMPC